MNASKRVTYEIPVLLALCLVFLFGCESLINDLDQDKLPKIESKLAVECYISPQSPRLEAVVTQSQPLFGPADYDPEYVKNAQVFLSDGQNRVQLMFQDSTFNYIADTSAFRIVAGKTYTLTVDDGKRFVKATCTVPVKLPVIKSFTVEKIYSGFGTDSLASIKLSWEDLKGESNFYDIRGYTVFEQTSLRFDNETNDAFPFRYVNTSPMYFGKRSVYNDINLDGITFNIPESKIYLPRNMEFTYKDKNGVEKSFYTNPKISEVRMEVLHIDENYYKFYRSLSNTDFQDNPFVEPTLIYSNVEGGLGCFGAFNANGKTINPDF
ncbi:DUF4249 domain-containing protein [Dyadobacter sediminis]|uniref:DUF4249 domain-containing protein n=1 Tax=Dyadobacter sediminis TaxID=1493691 RepID=A0A5R9KC09_9BACT|nr:DUF4249 domain-containing protein [Dyadobacter sediminis]TLU92315.1 DUF4249 domain-containing protein [Dyadobacter sediminis]GGB95500.1 hypothetical protein GCM10011325_23580 [Dyadobacter sediminis]